MDSLLMNYLAWLGALSALVMSFELLWPARPQRVLRAWLWSDYLHLIFNGHLFGVLLYGISHHHVIPRLDALLSDLGLKELAYFGAVSEWGWGLITQSLVALFVLDLLQWLIHNALHRSALLWEVHKVHHSVRDGEMDWLVSFRFSWLEPVIYKGAMYLPLMWFGFAPEALFFHAVFGTLIGHLNHANLSWDYGPLRYLLNSPRMHLYHHAYDAPATGQNFGIIFSCWDWIFGTHHLPDEPCPKIGFPGVEALPNDFFGQLAWPLPSLLSSAKGGTRLLSSLMGLALLLALYGAHLPPQAQATLFDEPAASSQPSGPSLVKWRAASAEEFKLALARFGREAQAQGWARPEHAISALELASALGSPGLSILDVRAGSDYAARFDAGHVPSAQLVTRSDYSGGEVPGVSLSRAALEELLRARGVSEGDELVIMGDGGPEPYRLWWTLTEVGGLRARVLDGGLAAWKSIGEALASGPGRAVERGDVSLKGGARRNLMWSELRAAQAARPGLQLLDTRSLKEFTGALQSAKASRAGHIPGARHLLWTEVLKLSAEEQLQGVAVLKGPAEVKQALMSAAISWGAPLVTYCQSGTRSSVVYYALLQAGFSAELLWNYDGSWAEYSRLPLEVATGEE